MEYLWNHDTQHFSAAPFAHAPLIDRTNSIDSSQKILTPIPSIPDEELNFSDVADARAKELLARSENENIELRVAWSGGVDSTTVLSALIKHREDYPGADIKVHMTEMSKKDFPLFYAYLDIGSNIEIRTSDVSSSDGKVTGKWLGESFTRDTGKDYILVTGEVVDHLGTPADYVTRWHMVWDEAYIWENDIIEFLRPLVATMPSGWGNKVVDVISWFKYTCAYQWSEIRMILMYDIEPTKVVHFFNTTEFQQWYLQSPQSVRYPGAELYRYKPELVDYIVDWTGMTEYKNTAVATDSLPVSYQVDDTEFYWKSLDENYGKVKEPIPVPTVNEFWDEDGAFIVEVTNIDVRA